VASPTPSFSTHRCLKNIKTLCFASQHVTFRRGKQAVTERRGQSFTICDVLQNDKMRRVLAFEKK
jgi:hypothetical protein